MYELPHHAYIAGWIGELEDAPFFPTIEARHKATHTLDIFIHRNEPFAVEHARALTDFFGTSSMEQEGHKFAYVHAPTFSHEAQQALLKTIEELGPRRTVILIAPSIAHFLDTVRSRSVVLYDFNSDTEVQSTSTSSTAIEKFFTASYADRLKQVKKIIDGERADAGVFLGACIQHMRRQLADSGRNTGDKQSQIFEKMVTLRHLIERPAMPVKLIMECACLIL